jgi:hypothetical protein
VNGFGRAIAVGYVALALSPLVFFALFSVGQFFWRMSDGEPQWWNRDAVTAPERAAELGRKGLVEQIVTFTQSPIGLRKNPKTGQYDLYAIGVGQTTLEEPTNPSGMFNMTGSAAPPSTSRLQYASPQPVTGQFNNLLIFEPNSGETTKVFSSRLAVSSFTYLAGPAYEVVAIFASARDSDKDGRLTNYDLQNLYLFNLTTSTLHKVESIPGNPIEISNIAQQSYAVVRAVQDADKNGSAPGVAYTDAAAEQSLLFRVDLRTYLATPLVPVTTLKSLQQTLDTISSPKAAAPAQP